MTQIWRDRSELLSGLDTPISCLRIGLHLLEIQRQQKVFIVSSLLIERQRNNCLLYLVNRIVRIIVIVWKRITCIIGKNYLTQPGKCINKRKYFPACPRYRWAEDEISLRWENFQLIWTELFSWWKLGL